MELGGKLTSGVDLWLNTPQYPLEASGTSGMKAALNGVPSLSILDGWWVKVTSKASPAGPLANRIAASQVTN
jgi:Glucan phosphorylase